MTERQRNIWNLLMERDHLTAGQIGDALHLSDRTVRTQIREINEELKKNAICSKRGQGFWIEQKEQPFWEDASGQRMESENLEWEIVRLVLFETDRSYLELADELYISDTLLTKMVGSVNRRMTRHYSSWAIRKENGKLVLNLSEREKRAYYSVYIITRNLNQYFEVEQFAGYFEYVDIYWIKELLLKELKEHETPFYDVTVIRLLIGTAVMAERIAAGCLIGDEDGADAGRKTASGNPAAEAEVSPQLPAPSDVSVHKILAQIGEYVGIVPTASERAYFLGLFRNDFYCMESMEQAAAAELLYKILVEIHVEYGFDFSRDPEFCGEMTAQLVGAMRRAENSQDVVNPVLYRVKAQYPLEYDIAIFFTDRFHRLSGCRIGEDEVGLIALHFIRAMETSMMHSEKKVALVNPFGKQVKELMKKRLEEMGECRVTIAYTYSIFDLPKFFPKDILAVLATVPLPENPEDVPVILCRNFLDYREKEKLLTAVREEQVTNVRTYFKSLFRPSLFFTEMEFDSKEQALRFLCDRLLEQGYVEEDFFASVMQREAIAPTGFEEGFAFAHGIENTARGTAVCTCLLKNKLAWGEYNVRILFLFALAPSWNHRVIPVYNVMIDNLMKKGAVKRLARSESCQEFVEMLL